MSWEWTLVSYMQLGSQDRSPLDTVRCDSGVQGLIHVQSGGSRRHHRRQRHWCLGGASSCGRHTDKLRKEVRGVAGGGGQRSQGNFLATCQPGLSSFLSNKKRISKFADIFNEQSEGIPGGDLATCMVISPSIVSYGVCS